MDHANEAWRQFGFIYERPRLETRAAKIGYENFEFVTGGLEVESDLINRPVRLTAQDPTPEPIDIAAYLSEQLSRETETR